MITKNNDLFDRVFDAVHEDDDIEDVLRVFVAAACATLSVLKSSKYTINMPDGKTIKLEILEPEESITWL